MELIEQQRLLARLYTDAETRRRWLAEPERFAQALGVDRPTAEKLSTQVESFARSLQRKRLGAVIKHLPATRKAMGHTFDELFLSIRASPCRLAMMRLDLSVFWKLGMLFLPGKLNSRVSKPICFRPDTGILSCVGSARPCIKYASAVSSALTDE